MKRSIYGAVAAAMLVALMACSENGEDEAGGGGNNKPDEKPAEQSAGYLVRGVVQDTQGTPLAGVAVVSKHGTTSTNDEGRYQLKLPEGSAVLKFSSSKHVSTIKEVPVSKEHATMLHVKLLKAAPAMQIPADEDGEIRGDSNSKSRVIAKYTKNSFVKGNKEVASGKLVARLTNIDASSEAGQEAAPGAFIGNDGGNRVPLESGGMLQIDVRDASGEKLKLKAGEKLSVQFPVPEGMKEPPPTMPLWSFNEETGEWDKKTEVATLVDKSYYKADLPHMSSWNCDRPLEATCIMGCAKDAETGEPLAGAQVTASGRDYVGSSSATTGADGCFRVAVRQNSEIKITVQHKLGGGYAKDIVSPGTATLSIPPTSADTCFDAGEFKVQKDVYSYGDVLIDCNAAMANIQGSFAACMAEMSEMMACPRPAGACTYSIGAPPVGGTSSMETTMRWESGARTVTVVQPPDPSNMNNFAMTSTSTAYGPEGQLCYTFTITTIIGTDPGTQMSMVYKDPTGKEFKLGMGASADGRSTVECPNGQRIDISAEESSAMGICQPKQDTSACAMEGLDKWGVCQSATDCMSAGEICCAMSGSPYGTCMSKDECDTIGGAEP